MGIRDTALAIIRGSLTVSAAAIIWRRYLKAMLRAEHAYENSAIRRVALGLSATIAALKITGKIRNSKEPLLRIDDSFLARGAVRAYLRVRGSVAGHYKESGVKAFLKAVREEIKGYPLQGIGIIILTALLTNMTVSLFLVKDSNPAGWCVRIIFFILGSCWVLCRVTLKDLIHTSWLFRLSERLRKI